MAQSTRCSLGEGGELRLGKRWLLEILRSLEKKKLSDTTLRLSLCIVSDTLVPDFTSYILEFADSWTYSAISASPCLTTSRASLQVIRELYYYALYTF